MWWSILQDGNLFGEMHPYYGKSMSTTISQAFHWVSLHFPVLQEIHGETHPFLIWWSMPQDGNLMEKTTHTIEKVWELISQALPIWWFCWIFAWYWKLIRKPIHLPSNEEYYGKIMSTNFPGPPHTMGFVAFFRTMGNWWENPCISHMIPIFRNIQNHWLI